jgi:hypothetical protein
MNHSAASRTTTGLWLLPRLSLQESTCKCKMWDD